MVEDKNVLSLFDGMSGAQIALTVANVTYSKYYASEIDKHAINVTQHNFPNTIQLGSVVDIDVSKLEPIHYLFGGSPCTNFSFSGKMKGMSTKCDIEILTLNHYLELKSKEFEFEGQSYLFWEYVRILTDIRKYNPDVIFLLENVKMTKKWERVLSDALGIIGVHIDSALVSAQSRKRIYWSNIKTRQDGLFGDLVTDIPQPKDKGILLKHILESNVPEKYYLSDKMLKYFDNRKDNFNAGKINVRNQEDKATTLTKSMSSCDISDNFIAVNVNGTHSEKAGTLTARYAKGTSNFGTETYIKVDKQLNPKSNQNKSDCFTAGGNSGGNHSDMDLIVERAPIQINPSKESGGNQPYQHNRVYDVNGISPALNTDARPHAIMIQRERGNNTGFNKEVEKSPSITSNSFEHNNFLVVNEGNKNGFVEIKPGEVFDIENPNSKTRRGRKMIDKTNALMSINHFAQYTEDFRIRRLTPTECKSLQTVPSWYEMTVLSDTQQYRCLGNGWNIDTIVHILSFLSK